MPRESEFLDLDDRALRAVIGPNSRHVALIEDAFKVLIEAPGGGVSINGGARDRANAKAVIAGLAARAEKGAEVNEADVRAGIGLARGGGGKGASNDPMALPVGKRGAIVPKTNAQARYLETLAACELSFGVGPAGTGKTFLAAAYGASLLRRGQVDRLVITRPAVEAGEKLGFLPGDLNEKVDPYLAPIWEALNDILGAEDVQRRRDKGEIEAAPIAFMRGRTLSHAFIIVDEAQNTSRLQMKMVLTRLGEGARMVVTGDPSQIDLLNPRDSGLAHALRILDGVKGVGVLKFEAEDVVRHAMVERIVRAYDADAAKGRPGPDLEDPVRMIDVEVEADDWTAALPEVEALVVRAATAALGGAEGAVAILLTDDAAVAELNQQFRAKPGPTNVLSFPAAPMPGDGPAPLGDLVLGYGVCAAEAEAQGKALSNHLSHLVVHGVLHLLGRDHEDDAEAEAMEAEERTLLAGLGIADPYGAEA